MIDYVSREDVLEILRRKSAPWDAYSQVKSIPAADVRTVVLGRWVGNKRHQSCSECHMTYCVPDGQDGELDMTAYHFCPNCGAMMEES